jgi:uncharacterized protein with PQ loop repeat
MSYDYLMLTASVCFFIGYLPELYANWKNKNANIYNLPERVLLLIGTFFAFSYSILTKNQALIINYTPILCLDAIVLLMRLYYWRLNNKKARVSDINLIEPQEDNNRNLSVVIVEEQDAIQP